MGPKVDTRGHLGFRSPVNQGKSRFRRESTLRSETGENTPPWSTRQAGPLTLLLLFLFFFLALLSGRLWLCCGLSGAGGHRGRGGGGGSRGPRGGRQSREHFTAAQSTGEQLQQHWGHTLVHQEADLEKEVQDGCGQRRAGSART